MSQPIYTHNYFLTAGECDAVGRMSVNLLIARLIEVATEHANTLGIGYSKLITLNLAWVLSRASVEVDRMPGINETYAISTWIESSNRLFSERCFEISGSDNCILARARTTWAAIDIRSRKPVNLSVLGDIMFPADPRHCAVTVMQHLGRLPDDAEAEAYTFKYCDLDFNRHVNTVRYIDLILNHWDLDHYDHFEIARFDITFINECYFEDSVTLRVATGSDLISLCEVMSGDTRKISASIRWRDRKPLNN